VKKIEEIHKEAKIVLKKSQEEIKRYVNKNRQDVVEYKVGDRVLLSTKNLV